MKYVNVYLYTEMDEFENVVPIRYELDEEAEKEIREGMKKGQRLLSFGTHAHNVDDIIKLSFYKASSSQAPYIEFMGTKT